MTRSRTAMDITFSTFSMAGPTRTALRLASGPRPRPARLRCSGA
jgi:hypothetical protein